MTICLIPARGGSKRIPQKNIKPFLGKPIIHYPIKTAKDSQLFDDIIVSTNDRLIRSVALSAGATVVNREPETDTDEAETEDVVLDVLKRIEADRICLMYSTSVFTTVTDLRSVVMQADKVLFSVCRYPAPIERAMSPTKGFLFNNHNRNSQDYEPTYYDAGQFYWFTRDLFLRNWPEKRLPEMPHIMYPMRNVRDINEPPDWEVAENLYRITR